MTELLKTRIDKWLCAVRLFKTRSLAAEACQGGKVRIEGESIKSSGLVKAGDTLHINKNGERWVILIEKIIEKRVGAPIAATCYKDLTPPEEKNKLKFPSVFYEVRDKGSGRPTKKDRREIDEFKNPDDF